VAVISDRLVRESFSMPELPVVVVTTPSERAERLEKKFNLAQEQLHNAIIAGELARSACNSNHPPLYRGLKFWGESTCALRLQAAQSGYEGRDTVGFATSFNRALGVAIVVVAGDLATGIENGIAPKTKYRKGTITIAAVEQNRTQLELFPEFYVDVPEQNVADAEGTETWFLLVSKDAATRELRAELSLPASMTADAKVTGWVERIILDPIPGDAVATPSSSQPPPVVDVPVERL
jgi:hypothetical protein